MTITLTPNTSRRDLKKRLAQSFLDMETYKELQAGVACERMKDEAAEKHRAITGPIQLKLRRSDDATVAQVVDRQPIDPAIEAVRQSLLDELETANVALQNAIRDADNRAMPHRQALLVMAGNPPNPQVLEARPIPLRRSGKAGEMQSAGVRFAKELQRLIPEVTKTTGEGGSRPRTSEA